MIIFEHTVASALIWVGIVIAVSLCVFSYLRYVAVNLHTLAMMLIRLLFIALLIWCLFLPGKRESETKVLNPRFIIAIDTSTSMILSPADNAPTRWDTAVEALNMNWTEFIRAECDIDAFAFATDTGPRLSLTETAELEPEGSATLLRDSLIDITSRYAGQNVAGLALLSDGIDTRETDDSWASTSWPFPIYTVLLEPETAWEKEPDVRVDSVHTPQRVNVGWKTELKAVISGEGTQGRAQNVELFRDGVLIDEVPIQLPAGGGSRQAEFELLHPEIGSFTYRVHVPPLEDESNRKDNEYEVSVQVIDAANRLLYVEGVPRWESKYLSRALRSNKQVSTLGFIKGARGEFMHFGTRGSMTTEMREDQLAFFKIVILGNLDATDLNPQRVDNLMKFVLTGGSLILLGGTEAWGPEGFIKTQLRKVMPVKSWGTQIVEGTFPVELTDEGRSHAAFAATDKDLWDVVPPVLSVFPDATLSPTAESLVNAMTPVGPQPIIATHRYGEGKVAVTMTDSLWKWVLSEENLEYEPYRRFWDQLLSWAMPEEEETDVRQIDVWTDREQIFLGEEVEIKARRTDSESGGAMTCMITTPAERRMTFKMDVEHVATPSGKSYPGFSTRFKADQPGIHQVVAGMDADGRKIESDPISFFVKPFTPESVPRAANSGALKLLARSSGGKYCSNVRELNDALSSLSFSSSEQEQVEHSSLWERWPVIGLLIALLSAGWLLRKMKDMP